MEIRYFGWSGVSALSGGVEAAFDLPEEDWESSGRAAQTVFFVTHGHNEHCRAIRGLLARALPGGARFVSSQPIVEYALGPGTAASDQARALEKGKTVEVHGTRVAAFAWRHMPLLPPGMFKKAAYLSKLLFHPRELAGILSGGGRLPVHAPTLGFRLEFPDGSTLLNYSEGLHSQTLEDEVEGVSRDLPAQTLLCAVEPEDLEILPRWIGILRPREVFLYEAHRAWREKFNLPVVDLPAYAREVSGRLGGLRVEALTYPGQRVQARGRDKKIGGRRRAARAPKRGFRSGKVRLVQTVAPAHRSFQGSMKGGG